MQWRALVEPVSEGTHSLWEIGHRPWPMPTSPWVMKQTWTDLLFAHFPVPVQALRRLVPSRFQIEQHDGTAWVGVVPFHMSGVRLRGLPPIPSTAAFHELNVRTYVSENGKRGVYFFSLDANSALAVWGARRLGLPYHRAEMTLARDGADVLFQSARRGANASFAAVYRPCGGPTVPCPGTLVHFLTERYCLYGQTRAGRPYRLDIHHRPWLLQPARAEVRRNTVMTAAGIYHGRNATLFHFARQQTMVAWAPQFLD